MRVVFLGPPGAGKGTQANLLQEKFGACQVSTGDILRKAVRDQSPLGKEASQYISKGDLVPDSVMVNLVAERLREKDCAKGFILDGFPRTIAQAEGLGAMLKEMGSGLDCVLSVQVPRSVIVERLAGRRTCKGCGTLYHLKFDPPKQEAVCDRCRGDLFQRDDDREDTVAARLEVYERQTAPLIEYYRGRGILRSVDGVGDVADIRRRVIEAVQDAGT